MSMPVDLSGINTVADLVAKMESAGYSVKKNGTGPKLDEKHFRRMDVLPKQRLRLRALYLSYNRISLVFQDCCSSA